MKEVYERIHENAKMVLERVGFRIKTPELKAVLPAELWEKAILENLEKLGKLNEFSPHPGHIYVPSSYTQYCVDMAPKSFELDPGPNSFGLGGRVQFIEEKDDLRTLSPGKETKIRPVTYNDLKRVVKFIVDNTDVIKFSHTPIGPPRGHNKKWVYRMAKIMDDGLSRDFLKGISMAEMSNKEVKQFIRKDWIHIFCGVESPLTEIPEKMQGIIRSAKLGGILGFSTMPMSGMNAPQTMEGLLTLCHAEVLFMLVLAQTVNPGVTCIHYGYPCPTQHYEMRFGSIQQAMANAALAHLNMEVTGLPSMQSAANTHQTHLNQKAIEEGVRTRAYLRRVGFHMMRHVFGITNNTNFFNFRKLEIDVEMERQKKGQETGEIIIPEDPGVLEVIKRRGSSPTYMDDYHTTKNIDCWGWD